MKFDIFRAIVQISTFGLVLAIGHTIYNQHLLKKSLALKNQKKAFGVEFLGEEEESLIRKMDLYLQNHEGRKLLNMMKNQEYYQEKIKSLIKTKQQTIQTTQDQELRKTLQQDIDQLSKLYSRVKPKEVKSLEQLALLQEKQRLERGQDLQD